MIEVMSKDQIEALFSSAHKSFTNIVSANVRRIAVFVKDDGKADVIVEFTRGGGYKYEGVDESVVESLIQCEKDAGSFGSLVVSRLKNKFPTTKIFSGVQD